MLERPNPPTLEKLGEELGQFDSGQPAGNTAENVGIVGADTAMRMGLQLVISVLGLGGAGYALDNGIGSTPLFMVVGLFLGAAAGFWMVIRTSKNPTKARK